MTTLLLIDDHALFRESLVRFLEGEPSVHVAAHCGTIPEAEEILARHAIDVILLDYDLGAEAGTNLLDFMHRTRNKARVLMLTAGMSPGMTLGALNSGVAGVVLKQTGTRQLLEAIDHVASGKAWWGTETLRAALEGAPHAAESSRELTERQRMVLRGVLDGLTNKEIAGRLEVSETSVKASLQELFNKAGVRTRGQLVRIALERFSATWL